jgi:hypothetical protein
MTDSPDDRDDLAELLAPRPPAEPPGLRDGLLGRTQRRLAWGRWVRRARTVGAGAVVFAAGLGVGRWQTPGERGREPMFVPVPVTLVEVVPVPVPVVLPPPDTAAPPAAEAVARSARALELDAEQADDDPTAARLYRQAGDAYLGAERDYANAARCYRLFLARAGDTALSPEAGDSWLLTSLKNAAFKEKIRATHPTG